MWLSFICLSSSLYIPLHNKAVFRVPRNQQRRLSNKKGWLTWRAKPKICGLLGFISLSFILSLAHFFLHFPSPTSPLKPYLESESSSIADEMCSFVRIRQQYMACGFDRLDTSKQTETILKKTSLCVSVWKKQNDKGIFQNYQLKIKW